MWNTQLLAASAATILKSSVFVDVIDDETRIFIKQVELQQQFSSTVSNYRPADPSAKQKTNQKSPTLHTQPPSIQQNQQPPLIPPSSNPSQQQQPPRQEPPSNAPDAVNDHRVAAQNVSHETIHKAKDDLPQTAHNPSSTSAAVAPERPSSPASGVSSDALTLNNIQPSPTPDQPVTPSSSVPLVYDNNLLEDARDLISPISPFSDDLEAILTQTAVMQASDLRNDIEEERKPFGSFKDLYWEANSCYIDSPLFCLLNFFPLLVARKITSHEHDKTRTEKRKFAQLIKSMAQQVKISDKLTRVCSNVLFDSLKKMFKDYTYEGATFGDG